MHVLSLLKMLLLVGSIATVVACSKEEPVVNPVPVIGFKAIRKFALAASTNQPKRDSVVTTITFSDGDGDLGEDTRDTNRLKQVFANQSWGSYEIRTFRLVNGTFNEVVAPANTPKLFFNELLSDKLIQPISGTLDFSQNLPYTGNYTSALVKFQIRVRDRSLNISNVIETDTVRVPLPL